MLKAIVDKKAVSLGVSALVVIAIIVIVAFAAFIGSSLIATSTTESTASYTTTSVVASATSTNRTASDASNGIRLSESLNSTTIVVGQNIDVSLSLFNTLPSVNSVLTSDSWLFQGVPVAAWPACYFPMPMQVVVLQGNYSAQQLPSVANSTFPVICMESSNIDHVIFQPNSSQANLTGTYSVTNTNQTLGPFDLQFNFTTNGCWNVQNLSKQLNPPILGELSQARPLPATAFVPGVYTVAVEDQWGQVAVLHVMVAALGNSSETLLSSTATTTTSSNSQAPSLATIEAANISLGGYPAQIAYFPNTSSIYVSDLFANTVSVINSTSNSVVTTITMPGTPAFGIAVDSQTGIVFVPVAGCTNMVNSPNPCDSPHQQGSIVEISAKTNTIVGSIPIGVNALDFNQNANTIWALNSESLYAINSKSGLLLANISLNADPLSVAVNPATNMVYVAACGQMSLACGQAELFIFNGATDSLKSTVSLSNYYDAINFNIVVDQSTNVVYVLGLGGPSMTLVSVGGTSGDVLSSYSIGSSCAGAGGGNLAINAARNQIYVSFEGQTFFLVLNASTGHITNMFSSSGTVFDTIYNSQTKQIYLTTNGSLLVLSDVLGTGYVNTNLLALGTCLP